MKIVDVTEFYSERGGGVRSHLSTRGHVLCQLGHSHLVIAPGPRDMQYAAAPCGPAADQTPLVVRVRGPSLPYDPTYQLLGRFDKIRARVRAARPDVLEAHSPYLATAAIALCGRSAARVRTAFWHADHVGTYVEPRVGGAIAARLWRVVRVLLAPFDATFAAGRAQAEKLRAAGVKNVVHVPFGVDARTFSPGARSQDRRRELLAGAAEGTRLVVGVGRFAIEKRWDVVIDAVKRTRGLRLVLFGDGPERARLEARARGSDVTFAGFERDRARLAGALASADLLVHGCPYETFGLGVAEAVACGVPVVVPDAGGAAESAEGAAGETYASLDAGACARAIQRVLSADLRSRALEAAARVPTVERHFARVLRTYEDLLRENA